LLSCGEVISSIVTSDLARSKGLNVTSLAPVEIGIVTDALHTDANILLVDTLDVVEKFDQYDVLVAPGFIGVSEEGFITTLGRGGSDTSAIALGASLDADFVDIYSDVVGVMTADPKTNPGAELIPEITYNELIEIAEGGAKVIHLKAIKLAKDCEVNLRFRSTFEDFVGTVVRP
jgi:aspartate kinase